jgi:hypothetical protein
MHAVRVASGVLVCTLSALVCVICVLQCVHAAEAAVDNIQ